MSQNQTHKIIFTNKGEEIVVDFDDYDELNQYTWYLNVNGYAAGHVMSSSGKKKKMVMHRKIIQAAKGVQTDHKNGNKLDNRKSNLRSCTHSENQMNRPKTKTNKSGYKGVFKREKDKNWVAMIKVKGKQMYLGSFSCPEDAAAAYDAGALKYHGEFAWTNAMGGKI